MPPIADPSAGTESIALRAFALLECVVESGRSLSLDELTQQLQLPKPTVFRIANLLKEAGLVRREMGGKRFTIGPRLTSFAVSLWRSDALRVQWHRALQDAVDEIGESCNLTLLESNQVLYLDRVETTHPLRLHLEAGTRVPLHCTAAGKLFLSRMSEAEMRAALGPEPYQRFTSRTLTSFALLAAEVEKVRRTGIGIHDSERFDDSTAIAVPVLAPDGSMVMAVAMHAPSSRANLKTCMGYVDALRRAADAVASTLTRPGDGAPPATRPSRRPAAKAPRKG